MKQESLLSGGFVVHRFGDQRFYTRQLPNGRYLAYRGFGLFIEGIGDTRLKAIEDLIEEEARRDEA